MKNKMVNNVPETEGECQEPLKDEGWHCDTYCRKIRHITCEGKAGVREGAEKQCPYLDEMLY